MENNQRGCYSLDEINELEIERNQRGCYRLDEIIGMEMERKSARLLLAR